MKPTHGGDTAAFESTYGTKPLDFSSNVSPLGVPEGVVRAIREAAEEADTYPDPRCRALTDAIAEKERVLPEWVLCGNGASDLIRRIAQAVHPKQALVTAPCFSEYEAALSGVNCHIIRYPLTEDFRMKEEILPLITEETGLLFLTQPCNPAGVSVPKALCERILARCEETGTRLVMDECFIDFLDAPDDMSMQSYVKDSRMLVVLKAFTKIYGMAGVRLGYLLCSDRDFAEAVYEAGASWSVSHLAQAAGIAALRETDYVARVR
ncbi:MAG: aminotransferase class I/II-fold pyridoxal phosphate-dependent enzyme, partial [Lachnospiraceae bacterium]|nr:aminotransferase class I/II-fold pyridoxal phosphate-dependent enzyme [Lachnospiraceae bacterium]